MGIFFRGMEFQCALYVRPCCIGSVTDAEWQNVTIPGEINSLLPPGDRKIKGKKKEEGKGKKNRMGKRREKGEI